jgi:simple sugar transport system ATP-binding protein
MAETDNIGAADGGAGTVGAGAPGVPAITLRGIRKQFDQLVAVDGVDLSFAPGEVHALLGENGAGKSTLMNIVAGFLAPDAGEIEIGGSSVLFRSPRDALAAGIGMVHQHFRLVEQFTVAENLAIGASDQEGLSGRSLLKWAAEIGERFDLEIDPAKPLWRLSVGEKQRVEILRTLARGARVLVLDEPTAVLTPGESDALLHTMRRMAGEGASVIFISHKLNEVLTVADRISVMRRGRLEQTLPRAECDIAGLARMMIGDAESSTDAQVRTDGGTPPGADLLVASGLSAHDERGLLALDDVTISVRHGEIVGIAGVAGNGQKELEEVLAGLRQPTSGSIRLDGEELVGRSVRRFIDAGVAYIPEDRKGMGLVPTEPIWRNAILKSYRQTPVGRGPFLRNAEAKRAARELAERVNLSTTNVNTSVGHLSGGNAQKLLAGRELEGDRRVVIAVNPSQGLDVGAIAAVWRQLLAARDRGLGVVLISADLDEVLHLSDRILVQYEGRIVGDFPRDSVDRHQVGLLMGGGQEATDA